MPLDALPDLAKYAIGITLIVLGLFGGYIVQDTWREPDQRSNVILRRIGYFWIGGPGHRVSDRCGAQTLQPEFTDYSTGRDQP